MSRHEINSYIISNVKATKVGYDIKYSNHVIGVDRYELNFVPQKGQKITVGLVNGTVTTVVIDGRKVR